jgi:hypothetical protein
LNRAYQNYGKKPDSDPKSGNEVRNFLSVAVFVLLFVGMFVAVSTFHPWKDADIKDEQMSLRMAEAAAITAAYGELAPWLTNCNQKASNPATCYFGTPDKNGVTPISTLIGEGVAAVTAGKKYDAPVAFAAAMKDLAKTNVKRLPKVGTDRAAWLYVQHADDKGYVIKGSDTTAPMCLARSTEQNSGGGDADVLKGMARCYNIALYQGYNRLADAPYPPSKYVPWSVVAVMLGIALLAGFLVRRGGSKPEDESTSVMPAWAPQP